MKKNSCKDGTIASFKGFAKDKKKQWKTTCYLCK
jgi:hypothetical protein